MPKLRAAASHILAIEPTDYEDIIDQAFTEITRSVPESVLVPLYDMKAAIAAKVLARAHLKQSIVSQLKRITKKVLRNRLQDLTALQQKLDDSTKDEF